MELRTLGNRKLNRHDDMLKDLALRLLLQVPQILTLDKRTADDANEDYTERVLGREVTVSERLAGFDHHAEEADEGGDAAWERRVLVG